MYHIFSSKIYDQGVGKKKRLISITMMTLSIDQLIGVEVEERESKT